MAVDLQSRLLKPRMNTDEHGLNTIKQGHPERKFVPYAWMALVKDFLQAAIWLLSFMGNRVEWRGEKLRLRRDGTLEKTSNINPQTPSAFVKSTTADEKEEREKEPNQAPERLFNRRVQIGLFGGESSKHEPRRDQNDR